MDSRTFHRLQINLVRRNPLVPHAWHKPSIWSLALASVLTDRKKSSIYKLRRNVCATSLPYSASFSLAVMRKAKLEQLGEETAPNR